MRSFTHWATSRDVASVRLPGHDAATGLGGDPLGDVQFGGAFTFDVFDAYGAGIVTNPNVVVAGAIGAGKSTVVKMQLDRALQRGRRVVVVDPKAEYVDLAARHGVAPVALGRDGWCDPFGEDEVEGKYFARALLSSALGSPLSGDQHLALDDAWRRLGTARPRRVLRALFEALSPFLNSSASTPGRSLALCLYRFVEGDLAGLFDGERSPVTLDGPLVVLDLSAQWSSESLCVAALSAVAAAQRLAAHPLERGYLVIDEAWALLSDPSALRWLQGSWKLARARGLSHLIVLHRFSDIAASGDAGSTARERARGLLRECETQWLFRQPPDEAREMSAALGLSALEESYLASLPRGVALVRYGTARSIVRVRPNERDRSFVDTDGAMRDDS